MIPDLMVMTHQSSESEDDQGRDKAKGREEDVDDGGTSLMGTMGTKSSDDVDGLGGEEKAPGEVVGNLVPGG